MYLLSFQQTPHPINTINLKKQQLASAASKIVKMTVRVMLVAGLAVNFVHAAEKLSPQDENFLIDAAQAGNAEIKASKLALQNSKDADIKSFAQTMIEDHTKISNSLKKLAAAKHTIVPADPSLNEKAQILALTVLTKLSTLKGHYFDKEYIGVVGVSAHENAVTLFKKTAEEAKDADIKQFATDNLNMLQHHLKKAQELKTIIEARK